MSEDKKRESSQDLLNYAIALDWLKRTFMEDRYHFEETAKSLSTEIRRRATPPAKSEQPDA